MLKTSPIRALVLGALALLLVAACSGGSSDTSALTDESSLLRFVPADTPYVFATGAPLPDDLLDALEPKINEMMEVYQVFLDEILASTLRSGSKDIDEEEARKMAAIASELVSIFSVDGMRAAGIERDSEMVLFGNGLLPVLRVEVTDEKLFEKALADIEQAADEEMATATLDGHSYRYIGDEEMRFAVGVFEGNAVLTILPADFDEAQLKQLFGLTLPANNLAATTVLADIVEKYDFSNHYIGYLDTLKFASIFLEQPTGLNAGLLKGADFDPASIPEVCKTEIRRLAGTMPRMVIGYDEISLDAISANIIMELRPDLSQALAKVVAAVPGLGLDQGGLFSFGMSANLLEWRNFYEERLNAMESEPFRCEYFADLQASVDKGRELLNQPLPPVVYGIKGFNAVIEDLGDDYDFSSGQPPKKVDANIVIAMDDAPSLVAMGTMFSPELAELNLQADGVPVDLQIAQVKSVAADAYAAMLDDRLAIAIGEGAEKKAASALNAKSAVPAPAFGMTMDAAKYYKLLATSMAMQAQDDDAKAAMSPEAQKALQDMMQLLSETYDRMSMDVRFTEHGAEVRTKVTLQDL